MLRSILPAYLLIDSSASMTRQLPAIEEMLIELTDELLTNPRLGDLVRVAVIGFSDESRVILPLSDLTQRRRIPHLNSGMGRRWGPAFDLLGRTATLDLRLLRADGVGVLRPLVVFIIGGSPDDPDWRTSYTRLRENMHPFFQVIAIGDVPLGVFRERGSDHIIEIDAGASPPEITWQISRAVWQLVSGSTQSSVRNVDGPMGPAAGYIDEPPDVD